MKIKKILPLLLLTISMLAFSACSAKNEETTTTEAPTTQEVTTETSTEATTEATTVATTAEPTTAATTATAGYPKEITDSRDIKITLQSVPTKIISLNNDISEIIFALGAGDKLVGRTDYDVYPPEISSVESIGNVMEPNFEKIASLNAELVICSEMFIDDNVRKIEDNGQTVIKIKDGTTIQSVYDKINFIADIVDKKDEAAKIIDDMKKGFAEIQDKVKGLGKPTVYYVVDYGQYGDYTAGGNTFIGEIINLCGGENIAEEVTDWKYSLEKIVEKDPQIIICSKDTGAKEGLKTTDGYKDLSAIKNGLLYEIDPSILNIAGPRLVEGAKEIAKMLRPEMFN